MTGTAQRAIQLRSVGKEQVLCTRPECGAVKVRPDHESPGPSLSFVTSRPKIGEASPTRTDPQPAIGKAQGWQMVFRSDRARRLLLRARDDDAARAGRSAKSRNLLPW